MTAPPTPQILHTGLPLAPIGERTTIANFLAKHGPQRPLAPPKIGKLLESKARSGRF